MKKHYFVCLLLILITTLSYAQNFANGDHFYDSGGENGDYSNNENITTVIQSSTNEITNVTFLSFSTEAGWDDLTVYDGPDNLAPLLGVFDGTDLPGPFTSTHVTGSLTFVFNSDGSIVRSGWDAIVTYGSGITCLPVSNFSIANISINDVALSWTSNDIENSWEIEYGLEGFTQGTGTTVQTNSNPHQLTGLQSGTNYQVYVKANCGTNSGDDDSLWSNPISFGTIPDYCNGESFLDSGGLANNYSDNENITTVITPNSGEFATITFLSFNLETNFDFLTIYDGPDNTATLLGTFDGTDIPGPFTSTHGTGSLTFVFTSDGSVTRNGWEANVQCEPITCFAPSDIVISNLTNESFDISWTDNNNPNTNNWEIEYGTNGFTLGTGTNITTPTIPYSITGLSSGSLEVYIRAICGANLGDDDSFWAGPYKVILPCIIFNAPISENFILNTIPPCWEESGSEDWNFNTDAAYDAANANDHTLGGNTNYAWIDGSNVNGVGQISNLTTPWIDVSSLTSPNVKFSIFSLNTFEQTYNTLDVILHEQSGISTSLLHLQQSTNGWLDYNFNITSLITDNIVRIEFIIEENSSENPYHNDILIDDFSLDEAPTCPNPFNLTSTNIQENSMDLNWTNGNTETNWEIEYGEIGFVFGTGTTLQINTNPYTLNNLDSGTEYQIYIRAICGVNSGDDDSIWFGPTTFTTTSNYCNGDHFYDSGGVNGNYSNNENTTTIISPQDANRVTVTFLSFNLENTFDFLTVYDGPDNTAPLLGTFTGTTTPGPFTSMHPSGSLTFVFTSENTGTESGWDATVFCENVTCPTPTNLVATSVTTTSTELNWTIGDTETAWEIEFGPFGFTPGTGTTISTNTNPYTLDGLEQGARQDIYIRAICGANSGDDDSNWSTSTTVNTSCGMFSAPFYESFDTDTTPGCWFEFGSENWNFGTDATFTAATAGDYTNGGNTNYAYIDGSGPTGVGQISNLITPFIDISNLTTPSVQFAIFSNNNNDNTFNTLTVNVNEQSSTTTNLLQLQEATNGWQLFTFDISNITSDSVQFEFIIEENSLGNSFFNDILIDDIKVNELNVLGNEEFNLNTISFYPNPVDNILTINSKETISNIAIYNLLGKEVFIKNLQNTSATIDFTSYSSGVYLVKVFGGNKIETFKIVKK